MTLVILSKSCLVKTNASINAEHKEKEFALRIRVRGNSKMVDNDRDCSAEVIFKCRGER